MGNLMSQKEVKRAQVLDMLKEDKISQQEASKRMGVSTRQVRRLSKRYEAEGLGGLPFFLFATKLRIAHRWQACR